MNPPDQPYQATPAGDLRQQIMDSRVPKNEREWWAGREIEKLERELTAASQAYECAMAIHGTVMEERDRLATELTAARSERDLAMTRVACILWSGAIDKHTCGDVQKWADYYTAELTRLRAQLAAIEEDGTEEHNAAVSLRLKLVTALDRADNAEADNAKWQKLLLMSRDDRESDLISEIEEQARLLGMSGEREADLLGKLGRLESELAAIKNGHGELGKYEQLRLKNAELQAELAAMKGTP
jgi:hypothetical protein